VNFVAKAQHFPGLSALTGVQVWPSCFQPARLLGDKQRHAPRLEEAIMKIGFAAGALLAIIIAMQGVTFAQVQKAPVSRYCLLERIGGGGFGSEMMTCRYNTLAQCMASKGAISDTCIVNPQLTFPPR
jgi:hypothetical protein